MKVQIKDNLTFKAQPVIIEDRQIKQLKGKAISMMKVLWDARSGDSTWDLEKTVRVSTLTSLFESQFFRTKIFVIGDNCDALHPRELFLLSPPPLSLTIKISLPSL